MRGSYLFAWPCGIGVPRLERTQWKSEMKAREAPSEPGNYMRAQHMLRGRHGDCRTHPMYTVNSRAHLYPDEVCNHV